MCQGSTQIAISNLDINFYSVFKLSKRLIKYRLELDPSISSSSFSAQGHMVS